MIVTIFETLAIAVPVALLTWAFKGHIDTMRAETKRERERMEAMWAAQDEREREHEQAEREQAERSRRYLERLWAENARKMDELARAKHERKQAV